MPVNVEIKTMVAEQMLFGFTLKRACHITSRHGDHVLGAIRPMYLSELSGCRHGVSNSAWPQQIYFNSLIKR